jgi:hypothetical protein
MVATSERQERQGHAESIAQCLAGLEVEISARHALKDALVKG